MDIVSSNSQVVFKCVQLILRDPKCTKKISPTSSHHNHQSELFINAVWSHAFMLFTLNSDPTIQMSQQKLWLKLANIFQILADRRDAQCSDLLQG